MSLINNWTLGVALAVTLAVTAAVDSGGRRFDVTDDCDPTAADWAGGCQQEEGSVTRAEFAAANANRYPGHPSWRIAPPIPGPGGGRGS